ncbi:hypothetical protein [Bacillus toyonensis]|uniref:hypothetical protein n=1 Tax=Bacillus toyonensis TaxID=155322 RepID=UPI000BF98656|nr:hypothetical protein [Bacillus toyonensis]PGA72733.1 hypothetical protein COL90_28340 [Bacillus toyonensis]
MDKQNKKEKDIQESLGQQEDAQDTNESLQWLNTIVAILEDLVAAFPEGCFCPPETGTIAQIKSKLDALFAWSVLASISPSLKTKLQNAITAVKVQLDAATFSCCDTIKALQALAFVLLQVIDHPLVGIPFKLHLLNLVQQLQALFVGYLACLACEEEPTGPCGPNPAIIINDLTTATPYPASIEIAGEPTMVGKVTVTLQNMNHPFPDDLDILLVGPQGQTVILMSDAGGNFPINNVTLTFNDDAPTFLPNGDQIVSGTFKPTDYPEFFFDSFPAPAPVPPYGSTLGVFNGTNPNGTWKLFVLDDSANAVGCIAGWKITVGPA